MAQSPEYPDLKWVTPRSWSAGRPYGQPLWIVVHTTEGSEGLTSAEAGAAYDARRTDGTSTHYMHDQDSTIQCVRTTDRAHAAKGTGNHFGIHHELCGRAAQSPAQWHDTASTGTLARFARQAARDCVKWDIPVRRLTVTQVRSKQMRGFCAHADITAAFGESTHSDPGSGYPWSEVLGAVRDEMEDDMTEAQLIAALSSPTGQAALARAAGVGVHNQRLGSSQVTIGAAVQNTSVLVGKLAGQDFIDEQALATALMPLLSGNQLETVIRNGMSVADRLALAARLAA